MESESYQRARRRAALAGGGLLFAATLVAFLYQLPSTFFPHTAGPFWLHWLAFAVFYMAYATLSLPFDVWAGYWLPCRHQRSCRLLPVYLGALFRAETAQFAGMTLSSLLLLEAGIRWGAPGALTALAAAQTALVIVHPWLGRYLGSAARRPPLRAWLPGMAWHLAGFALLLQTPFCGVDSVHRLLEALLGSALWSLFGYWLLRVRHRSAAGALLYLSWAGFGLFSRATAGRMGLPETWIVAEEGGAQPERNSLPASQIAST
ncbi:MAG: hypothetical protein WHT08_16080 [Bryobacteraceae bacterium]